MAITGSGTSGSNSVDAAFSSPAMLRAYSITMHCRPRHRPSVGMPCVLAYVSAPSLPSMPRIPKPPGTTIASTSSRWWRAPDGVSHSSEGIQRMLTFASCAKPPARRASLTER